MNQDQRSALRKLASEATPAIRLALGCGEPTPAEAFYAAARTAVPNLLDQLDRAEAECERLRKIERDRNYALQCQNEQLESMQAGAELAAAQPIVAAAMAWRDCFDDEGEICNRIALGDIEVRLADAIDAARRKLRGDIEGCTK